jgi:hypothetical protein
MRELIPIALFCLIGQMLNAILAEPIAALDSAIFRGLRFPDSFVAFFGSENVIRWSGRILIALSPVLLVVGLLG